MVNSSLLESSILNTLQYFSEKSSALTLDELFIYLNTADLKSNVKKADFVDSLQNLVNGKKVDKYGTDIEYYSLAGMRFEKVKPEIPELRIDFSFIILFAIINPLFINGKEKLTPHFYVFVKENTLNISRFLIKYKLRQLKCFKYNLTLIEEKDSQNLLSKKDLATAHLFISLQPIINNLKFYEFFVAKNLWLFNYLGNYPVNRINLSYRSKYKVEKASKLIRFADQILKLFKNS